MVDGACVAANGAAMDNMMIRPITAADAAKGHGLDTRLVGLIEDHARELGYQRLYLETHSNLKVAIHLYEKLGYRRIEPINPSHATMDHCYLKEL